MKQNKKVTVGEIDKILLKNDFSKYREYSNEPFDPQFRTAFKIIRTAVDSRNKGNYVILNGLTQGGKTGVLCSLLAVLSKDMTSPLSIYSRLGVKQVFFITGNDSVSVLPQLYEDLGKVKYCTNLLKAFKRSDLVKDMAKYKNRELTNALVFIDESHYETKEDLILPINNNEIELI